MIEEIKRIFDDIRDGIIEMGGNIDMCTSPEEYAEAIKGLSGNNAVLFIPCFKASETKPETPTKTMSPADPTDYPDGWGTPDGLTGKIWMTYTVVSVSTTYVPWTEPVLLGAAGESPTPPVYEPQVTRTFVICMELPEAEITPNIPTGGKWDVNNNVLLGTIEYPSEQYTIESILSNGNTAGWSCNNNHVSGGYTWMSVGTFLAEDGSQVGSWSDPMCINSARDGVDGHDGRNGVDGTDIEFIYMLLARNEDPASIPAPPSDPDRDDDVPITGHVPDWTDQPSSIDSDNYPIEIMCQRKKNVETGKWGPFVGPAVWSSWGEDGMDGDGVEYIFRVATNAEVTQDANGKYHLNDIAKWPPTCGDNCANAFYTVAAGHGYTREELTEIYQQDDFVPGSDISHPRPTIEAIGWDRNWTDDPRDVDINEPFEFVSIRKYDGETGTWGWFSTPVLWNKYYVTSAPIFTSYAFCRSTKNLGNMTLSGGTVLNPLPSDQTVDGELIHWYDGIPGAAEYGAESTRAKAPIWMTSSKFGSADPTVVIAPDWTSPVLMADSKFFNVEYSASDTFTTPLPKFDAYLPGVVSGKDYPFINNADSEGVDEATWRSYCTSNGYGTWGDTVTNPKWMATCTFEDGHWTNWTVTQIEGEAGGTPEFRYQWNQSDTTAPSYNSGSQNPGSSWSTSVPNRPGNGYYLWAISAIRNSNGTYGAWGNPIRLTGDTGSPGEDGDEREWIYNYSISGYNGSTGQVSPNGQASGSDTNKNQKDWVPNGWYDNPQGVSSSNLIEYASWRDITHSGSTTTYGAFQTPIVWSHYGQNGVDGDGIEYAYIRTNSATPPTITTSSDTYDGKTYLDDEYLPLSSAGRCTDDPTGVDSTHQYEYVVTRSKGSPDSTGRRVWTKYPETSPDNVMKLWAKWGADGRGIVSVAYYYMWSNDGTNHPSASDPSWSASIPANPNNYTYLWRKTVTTYSSGTITETTYEIISKTGQRGPIGPKMRMRNWKTNYSNPDTEGQTGWLNGDGANDAFYDIAIYPAADEGITVTNAASNADRLWRCIQPLSYTTLATIISQAGDASLVYPGSTYLQGYFSQAVGWDFVATSLLLANKISANQIETNGLSAKSIVTDATDGSYASVSGNTMELKKNGATKCKISGNPITLSVNSSQTPVWDTQLGYHFMGGQLTAQGVISRSIDLGTFEITVDQGIQRDVLYSSNNQVFGVHFTGTVKQGVINTTHDIGVYGSVQLSAINVNTEQRTTWYQNNYGELGVIVQAYTSLTPGETKQYFPNVYTLETDQSERGEFDIGTYRLVLDIDLIDAGMSEYFEDMYVYLNQDGTYGSFYPIINHHSAVTDLQYTDIGTDGFAHVLDADNYFSVRKVTINNSDCLQLKFLSNATYGMKIDAEGIKYTTNGGTTWSSNWAALNS